MTLAIILGVSMVMLGASGIFYYIIGSWLGGLIWIVSAISAFSALLIGEWMFLGLAVGLSYTGVGIMGAFGFWSTVLFGQGGK